MFTGERIYTKLVVLICVIVYFWELRDPSIIESGAFSREDLTSWEAYRIVVAGFLHADFTHLFNNMIIFYLFARQLEPLLVGGGRWQYPLVYIGSLVGGAVGHALLHPEVAVIGASGGVFGIVACAATYSWRLGYSWWLVSLAPGTRFHWLLSPVPLLVLFMVSTMYSPEVSVGGHIGGALFGGAIGIVIAGNDPGKRNRPPEGWQ
jgi:membrane associated rhomboid family serine protease